MCCSKLPRTHHHQQNQRPPMWTWIRKNPRSPVYALYFHPGFRVFSCFSKPRVIFGAPNRQNPDCFYLTIKKARVSPLPRHYQPTSFWWLLPLYSYFGGFSTFYFFSSSVALPVTFSFLPLWLSGFIVFFVFLFFYFFGVLATSSLLFSHPNTTTFLQKQKRTQQPQKIEYFSGKKAHHPFLQKRRRI